MGCKQRDPYACIDLDPLQHAKQIFSRCRFPPPRSGGNIDNKPSPDPGACCATCNASYYTWYAANKAEIDLFTSSGEEGLEKTVTALLKTTKTCKLWTFVPGATEGNGTCFIKNGTPPYRLALAQTQPADFCLPRRIIEMYFSFIMDIMSTSSQIRPYLPPNFE